MLFVLNIWKITITPVGTVYQANLKLNQLKILSEIKWEFGKNIQVHEEKRSFTQSDYFWVKEQTFFSLQILKKGL